MSTCRKQAPEIDSGNYNESIDIYSLGIILIEMLLNCITISEKMYTINKMIKTKKLTGLITDKYNTLILQMINPNPELRISINDIII